MPTGRDQPPSTKKSARALGCRTEDEWVRKYRVPRRDAEPLMVKGTEFFKDEDCEDLATRTQLKKRGIWLPPDAEPVDLKYSERMRKRFYVYRESDGVPFREPAPEELLEAIRRLSTELGWFSPPRDATEDQVFLFELKEEGIRYAHTKGYLGYVGRSSGSSTIALYVGGRQIFRSTVVPTAMQRVCADLVEVVAVFLQDELPDREEPSLEEAIRVLGPLPKVGRFRDVGSLPQPRHPERSPLLPPL